MFSKIFPKLFTGNWNRKMEPGNDSFGPVSGYPDTQHSLIAFARSINCPKDKILLDMSSILPSRLSLWSEYVTHDDKQRGYHVNDEKRWRPVAQRRPEPQQKESHGEVLERSHPEEPVEFVIPRRIAVGAERPHHGILSEEDDWNGEETEEVAEVYAVPVRTDEHGHRSTGTTRVDMKSLINTVQLSTAHLRFIFILFITFLSIIFINWHIIKWSQTFITKMNLNQHTHIAGTIVLARGVSGCLWDTLFQFWTPYFICLYM